MNREAHYAAIERYRAKLVVEGIKATTIRVPEHRIDEIKAIAAEMRKEHRANNQS